MPGIHNVVLCLAARLCPTLCNPMDCSLPGSSVHRDSPDKNTGVSCQALLQGIFPTQRSNPSLPQCRQVLYHMSIYICNFYRSDQLLSCVRFFATPWISAHQTSLSITNSRSSLRLTSIESVMPSSHLILCRPLHL